MVGKGDLVRDLIIELAPFVGRSFFRFLFLITICYWYLMSLMTLFQPVLGNTELGLDIW